MHRLALAGVALVGLAGHSRAQVTVVLPAAADNTIYQESGDLSNGAGQHIFAGKTDSGQRRRALIRFNLSTIPAGSTIQSVRLDLYCTRTSAGATPVSLRPALASWGEGTSDAFGEEGSGAGATIGDATWTDRFHPSSNWLTPGGDYSTTSSATTSVGGSDTTYSWTSSGMVNDVAAWSANPAQNHGWIILGDERVTRTAKRFASRQSQTPSQRPALRVVYTPPAAFGACCLPDLSCLLASSSACAALGGSYRGDGSTCATPCPPPCDSLDFNNDGIEQDPTDLEAFLSIYSGGPCIPASAICADIDFNNDGLEQDPTDLEAILRVYSGGPCTP